MLINIFYEVIIFTILRILHQISIKSKEFIIIIIFIFILCFSYFHFHFIMTFMYFMHLLKIITIMNLLQLNSIIDYVGLIINLLYRLFFNYFHLRFVLNLIMHFVFCFYYNSICINLQFLLSEDFVVLGYQISAEKYLFCINSAFIMFCIMLNFFIF